MSRDSANGHSATRVSTGALARVATASLEEGARSDGAVDASAIRAEIDRTRTEVLAAMDDLHDRWGEVTNWRGLVARRPWTFVLAAVGLGALTAFLVGSRTRPRPDLD